MESDLQHEDLLIKLRSRLNEEKVKLWEPPHYQAGTSVTQSVKDLATKYATELSISYETVLQGLSELQEHSLDRSKANAEFKETGLATLRVKATISGQKGRQIKIQKRLDGMGTELLEAVGNELGVAATRVKLIFNGKVLKSSQSLEQQGIKNGAQIMALVMPENPEEMAKEDLRYMEMKTTRDDAVLLSECADDIDDDDEYMKLEDQSGKAIDLPAAERRSLMVGLALHERGRAAARQKDYTLALVLLLEADSQLSSCRSSILQQVDNYAVLQLDIVWSYAMLDSAPSAADGARRLYIAERSLQKTYGGQDANMAAASDNGANERVLFMRLYLLQGLVAYHQNKRSEAQKLLDKAENEMNALRVDSGALTSLMELGWAEGAARRGLRAAHGDVARAHDYLEQRAQARQQARETHRRERQERLYGSCADGTPVSRRLVEALLSMGFSRRASVAALSRTDNHVAEAVRLIQEEPEFADMMDWSNEDTESPSSEDSLVEPDGNLIAELEKMGYATGSASRALILSQNKLAQAVDILLAAGGSLAEDEASGSNPSTSAADTVDTANKRKAHKPKKDKRRKECEAALERLSSALNAEEEDHLDTSLEQEEELLARYKSLL